MSKQKYLWIVERKIGRWMGWVTRGKRGPKPDSNGFMEFLKGKYALDPKKFRRFKVPQGIRAGDEVQMQIWREDESTPLDFMSPEKKIGDDITATMIQRVSKIKRLDLITADRELDPMLILLILSILGNLVAIGYLVSLLT